MPPRVRRHLAHPYLGSAAGAAGVVAGRDGVPRPDLTVDAVNVQLSAAGVSDDLPASADGLRLRVGVGGGSARSGCLHVPAAVGLGTTCRLLGLVTMFVRSAARSRRWWWSTRRCSPTTVGLMGYAPVAMNAFVWTVFAARCALLMDAKASPEAATLSLERHARQRHLPARSR